MNLGALVTIPIAIGAWIVSAQDHRQVRLDERIIKGNASQAPYDFLPETWGRLMSNPNATGRFTFDGPNISAPYPTHAGNDSIPRLQWAMSLDLKADVPLGLASRPSTFDPSAYVAGGVLSLTPPEDLVKASLEANEPYRHDRTWKICVYTSSVPQSWDREIQAKAHENGSCEAMLDSNCTIGLASAIADRFVERLTDDILKGEPSCPSMVLNDCLSSPFATLEGWLVSLDQGTHIMYAPWNTSLSDGKLHKPTNETLSNEMPYYNGSAIVQWASHWGDKGNMTAYDEEVGVYWPVFVAFGYNETWMARDRNSSKVRLPQRPLVQYLCAKAQQAAPGSLLPKIVSAGATPSSLGWFPLLLSFAVALTA